MALVALGQVTVVCEIKLLPITEGTWIVRFDSWLERWNPGLGQIERKDLPWRSQYVVPDVPSSVKADGLTALGAAHNVPVDSGTEFDDVLACLNERGDKLYPGDRLANLIEATVWDICHNFVTQLQVVNYRTKDAVLPMGSWKEREAWRQRLMTVGSDDIVDSRLNHDDDDMTGVEKLINRKI